MTDLVLYPDPRLEWNCEPVKEFGDELKVLIDKLVEVMERENGVGLAAPQIGVGLRVFVYRSLDGSPNVAVNPELVAHSLKMVPGVEGCLSIPGREFSVPRPYTVHLKAKDECGTTKVMYGSGFRARVFMHELDHLAGTLLFFRGDDLDGA